MIYHILLLALFASCESAQKAPLVLYESPHGLVVLKAARLDFATEDKEAVAARAHFDAGADHLSAGRAVQRIQRRALARGGGRRSWGRGQYRYFDDFVAEWTERGGAEMTQEAREIYKVRAEIYRKVGVR